MHHNTPHLSRWFSRLTADTLPAMKSPNRALAIFVTFVMVFITGCGYSRPLRIEPITNRGAAKPAIEPKFTESYYYYDRDHTLYFILRSKSVDPETKKLVEQIATFRIFWHPIGGKTSLNPTSLNATYRYVLMTPDSVGMYEGAGFVRLSGKDGKKHLKARLMQGDLRLTEASANFVDTLGRCQIHGSFTATYDDVTAMDMLLAAHREFFARSLLSKPAPASTEPSDADFAEPDATIAPPSANIVPTTQPQ
jgi:hypothetical protein